MHAAWNGCRASASYETAQVVLNLHAAGPTEIELPGLLVRIIAGTNTSSAHIELSADEEVSLPGQVELSDDEMDVWSPFFGTLMALTTCCVFIAIAAVLEKTFMCVGGEAIHSAIDEQNRINQKLSKIIDIVGPLVDHVDTREGVDGEEMIQLVTNDGEPMTPADFLRNVSALLGKLATPDRVASGQARAGEAVATKIGGPKAATAVKVGEKVYDKTQHDTQSNKKGNRKDKKNAAVRCFSLCWHAVPRSLTWCTCCSIEWCDQRESDVCAGSRVG